MFILNINSTLLFYVSQLLLYKFQFKEDYLYENTSSIDVLFTKFNKSKWDDHLIELKVLFFYL